MQHSLCYNLMQLWFQFQIRNVSPDHILEVFRRTYLVSMRQEDNEVHMRQPSFLELNCVNMSHVLSQNTVLDDIFEKSPLFQFKDLRNYIGPIVSRLSRK